MTLNVSGPFIYFTIPIFGGINITQTTVSSLLVTILVCGFCIALGKNLSTRPGPRQILVEKGVLMLRDMVVSTMGAHNEHWTPFILTLFLSSLFGSLIGMTGFLRSSTADLSCTLVWALMVTAIIWYNNIKNSGVAGWLKGFTEPIAIMTPMNIISEIAQPISMAFRHFGNLAGGGVITSVLYMALSLASTAVLNLIAANGWMVSAALMAAGAVLFLLWRKSKKLRWMILGWLSLILGLFGFLQAMGWLAGVPVLAFGIPAVLSCYFDIFSGGVQALVFILLRLEVIQEIQFVNRRHIVELLVI
jgi:F-type H+-transporting ATPase subunit a